MLYGLGDLLIGNSVTIPSYMALGSSSYTLMATDNSINGEFTRQILGSNVRSANLVKFDTLFSGVTASSLPINVVGLMNSSTSGDLWCSMLMANVTQTSSFDVEIEMWVQFNGA